MTPDFIFPVTFIPQSPQHLSISSTVAIVCTSKLLRSTRLPKSVLLFTSIASLVHFRLRQRLDDTSTVKEAATRSIRAAQRPATFSDVIVASQAAELDAAEPATAYYTSLLAYSAPWRGNCSRRRTIIAARHAPTSLAVGSDASILLQVGVCHTAGAAGDGTALILAGHEVSWLLRSGGSESREAEDDGGQRKLHFGWLVMTGVYFGNGRLD